MYPDLKKEATTKDQIINILSYEWPLSIKKIYSILKIKYKSKVTYQAIHKAIREMVGCNNLKKTKEGYCLNLDWIKDIHNQTEIIRVNYFSKSYSALFTKEESLQTFIFNTWFDVEKYLYYLQKNFILNLKNNRSNEIICYHHNHEWRPVFYLRAEYNWAKMLKSLGHKTYTLCSENTTIDNWSKKFYERLESNIKLGIRCTETSEIMVFGDLVIQIFIPLDLKQKLSKELKNLKDISKIDHSKLINQIFEKQTEIKVIINKDKSLAEQIKKQTMDKFQ